MESKEGKIFVMERYSSSDRRCYGIMSLNRNKGNRDMIRKKTVLQ